MGGPEGGPGGKGGKGGKAGGPDGPGPGEFKLDLSKMQAQSTQDDIRSAGDFPPSPGGSKVPAPETSGSM